jgi:hypothetical protein
VSGWLCLEDRLRLREREEEILKKYMQKNGDDWQRIRIENRYKNIHINKQMAINTNGDSGKERQKWDEIGMKWCDWDEQRNVEETCKEFYNLSDCRQFSRHERKGRKVLKDQADTKKSIDKNLPSSFFATIFEKMATQFSFEWILMLPRTAVGWQLTSIIHNHIRVARWFVFKPKIPIWVNFGGP